MELLRRARTPGAALSINRISTFRLDSWIHMAWHLRHLSPPPAAIVYRPERPAAGQAPFIRVERILGAAAKLLQAARSRLARTGAAGRSTRIAPLEQRTRFLTERLRTVTTRMVAVQSAADADAAPPSAGLVARAPGIVVARARRIEDPVPRMLPEVVRAPAVSRSAPLPQHQAGLAAPSHLRRGQEAAETVHVAPWLKTPAPPVNVAQLAEQVIRQIDNRVIAWRERMGRV